MMMKKVTLETIVYFLAMAFSFKNAIEHIETFFFEGLLDFAFAVMFGYFLYKKMKISNSKRTSN